MIKPPLYDEEITASEALVLVHDKNYYKEVMLAGIDPLYAYRYLSWRLNCPHHTDDVLELVSNNKPEIGVVWSVVIKEIIKWHGTGGVSDEEIDVKEETLKNIYENGMSFGHFPDAPHVGEWKNPLQEDHP